MNSANDGTNTSVKTPRQLIIEEMFTEAQNIWDMLKENNHYNDKELAWCFTCITIAHLSNYVHTVIPHWKKGLLDLTVFLAELELQSRNDMASKQNQQTHSPTVEGFLTNDRSIG